MAPLMASPPYPLNYVLDRTKLAGEIPYETGTSNAGQVEVSVPIEPFATEYEYAPQVAIRYDSQGGSDCLGKGWRITGLSRIEPANKTFFTDGNVQGKNRVNGAWSLDGNRLVLQETNDTAQVFLTQTGNIRVIHRLNGTGYKVYLPDGTICDYSVSSGNGTFWHINNSIAPDGQEITYTYYDDTGEKLLSSIGYGEGRSMDFEYENAVNEQSYYIDGVSFVNRKRLSSIEVKYQDRLLREYVMTYRNGDITSPLVQVDMLDSVGNAVNPLHFHYQGDSALSTSESQMEKHVTRHFDFQNPEGFISLRGKLEPLSEDDAVIIYPNKRNYYIKGGNHVGNDYNANDQIIIYYDLNGMASHYDTLYVDAVFVDAFCMDVDGQHGEEFVKVNQYIYDSYYDRLKFDVYQQNIYGLFKINTITKDLTSLVKNGARSIWPTQFLTGDFTGDGREEVLVCRSGSSWGE